MDFLFTKQVKISKSSSKKEYQGCCFDYFCFHMALGGFIYSSTIWLDLMVWSALSQSMARLKHWIN